LEVGHAIANSQAKWARTRADERAIAFGSKEMLRGWFQTNC
jgi:hypothetical protein